MPDTPQRIATGTNRTMPVSLGEPLKGYKVSLKEIGFAEKVTVMFNKLLSGSEAVRETLNKYLR